MNRILPSLVVIASFALAACGVGGPSGSSTSTATPAPSGAQSSAAAPTAGDGAGAGQTDTEWGRIWDTLPNSFPQIPGERPTDEATADPASARFVIAGDVARLVATALDAQLASSGFPTAGLGAPLEDGSYVLDATGPTPDCKVQVTVSPKGGETFVTILYGAACPHD
jgi:hypothetical protein